MTVAPLGSSWLQADLKKGSACWKISSPGFRPSHIPLKSCTFSSSSDMISESFCFKSSEHTETDGEENILNQMYPNFHSHQHPKCASHLSSPWLYSLVVSCHLLSHWEFLHLHPSHCPAKKKEKKPFSLQIIRDRIKHLSVIIHNKKPTSRIYSIYH